MRNSENYYKRLKAIQTFFMEYPNSTLREASAFFSDIPKGTISATMSFMHQSGHLIAGPNNTYSSPSVLSTPKQIASDIFKLNKAKRNKPASELKLFVDARMQNVENVSIIQKQIEDAIVLLKSKGYKILARKTEYAEI